MASLAQYLHPALWREWIEASAGQLHEAAFWVAVLQLIFVDLLLSGDNAVVIAMACRGLPPAQRRWGIVVGAGIAVILRVVFIGVIAGLLQLPYLKLVGGVALLVVAARLLVPEDPNRGEGRTASHLGRAIAIIAVADIVMSLDNIIAIAAIAQGNLLLLAIGLVISIPLIMVGAALIVTVLDRYPIFVWAGAALLGWIAGKTIAGDPAVHHWATLLGDRLAQQFDVAAAGAAALLAVALGGLWRNWRETKTRMPTSNAAKRA